MINSNMNYRKIYDDLVRLRTLNPVITGYTERHHILPRSLGGTNDKSNLVHLTGREHWVAHLLLWKITGLSSMAYACHMMAMKCDKRGIPSVRNSRMYERIRIECLKRTSEKAKKRTGPLHNHFGTMWICNIDLKKNNKILKTESIPAGWIAGRNVWNKKQRLSPTELAAVHAKRRGISWGNHKPDTIERIRQANLGENNPMVKLRWMWITDGKTTTKLFLPADMPSGFRRGMKHNALLV